MVPGLYDVDNPWFIGDAKVPDNTEGNGMPGCMANGETTGSDLMASNTISANLPFKSFIVYFRERLRAKYRLSEKKEKGVKSQDIPSGCKTIQGLIGT